MFRDLALYEDDPIESMFVRLAADHSAERMDLGIGVYRDDSGEVPVFRAVRDAELRVVRREGSKSYIGPLGNLDYCRAVERLVLGPEHAAPGNGHVITTQTGGAGSALRLGAELVRSLSRQSRVWVSDPVWPHQLEFFEQAGMQVMTYRYYDQYGSVPQFDDMLEDLKGLRRDDLLLLHGCCHNPTGQDLELDQWQAVSELVAEKGAVPFVDVAYQGVWPGHRGRCRRGQADGEPGAPDAAGGVFIENLRHLQGAGRLVVCRGSARHSGCCQSETAAQGHGAATLLHAAGPWSGHRSGDPFFA